MNSPSPPAEIAAGDPSRMAKRSVLVAGHHTSLTLEDAFWNALKEIARDRGLSVNALVTEIHDLARIYADVLKRYFA